MVSVSTREGNVTGDQIVPIDRMREGVVSLIVFTPINVGFAHLLFFNNSSVCFFIQFQVIKLYEIIFVYHDDIYILTGRQGVQLLVVVTFLHLDLF